MDDHDHRAVTKPVIGLVDMATSVSEGIRNTTTVFDDVDLFRLRLPRAIPLDSILKVLLHWIDDGLTVISVLVAL